MSTMDVYRDMFVNTHLYHSRQLYNIHPHGGQNLTTQPSSLRPFRLSVCLSDRRGVKLLLNGCGSYTYRVAEIREVRCRTMPVKMTDHRSIVLK